MYGRTCTGRAVAFFGILFAQTIANTDQNLQNRASSAHIIFLKNMLLLWRLGVSLLFPKKTPNNSYLSARVLAFSLSAQIDHFQDQLRNKKCGD